MKKLNDSFWGRLLTLFSWILLIALLVYGIKEVAAGSSRTLTAIAAEEDGKKVFAKCKACHSFDVNRKTVGPHLVGIVGRKFAIIEGYKYSKALTSRRGLRWTEDNLGAWLSNPRSFIPKSKMAFPGIKKEEQLDALIEYLKEK